MYIMAIVTVLGRSADDVIDEVNYIGVNSSSCTC